VIEDRYNPRTTKKSKDLRHRLEHLLLRQVFIPGARPRKAIRLTRHDFGVLGTSRSQSFPNVAYSRRRKAGADCQPDSFSSHFRRREHPKRRSPSGTERAAVEAVVCPYVLVFASVVLILPQGERGPIETIVTFDVGWQIICRGYTFPASSIGPLKCLFCLGH